MLDRVLRFSIVLVRTMPIVLESGKLVLMISESSFGGTGLCSLLFDLSTPQVMTSTVGIAESLVLFSDSNFSLFDPFVCSLDFFFNLPLLGLKSGVSKRDYHWQKSITCSVRASAFNLSNPSFI